MVHQIKITTTKPVVPTKVEVNRPTTPQKVIVGIQGPKGAPGSAGAALTHSQLSPANPWIINHNLGRRPNIALYTIGGVEMIGTVMHMTDNQAQVSFASSQVGYALIV